MMVYQLKVMLNIYMKIVVNQKLFSTHYHELNDMSNMFDRIKNYNVSVKEIGKK